MVFKGMMMMTMISKMIRTLRVVFLHWPLFELGCEAIGKVYDDDDDEYLFRIIRIARDEFLQASLSNFIVFL